jgi:hypothetical protein
VAEYSSGTPSAEQVAQSVLAILLHVYGPEVPPALHVPPVSEALSIVANAPDLLSGPSKLELLAQVMRSNLAGTLGGTQSEPLQMLASSLVSEGADASRVSQWLLNQLRSSVDGEDPLGRYSIRDLGSRLDPGDLAEYIHLRSDVRSTVIAMGVRCEADPIMTTAGQRALSIKTSATTTNPLAAYRALIDPLNWPDCPVQAIVFKKMQPVDPQTLKPINRNQLPHLSNPDNGWSGTVQEMVDLGLNFIPGLEFTTYLEFIYFDNEGQAFQDAEAIGCTYDLRSDIPNGITADRGYLLAVNDPSDPSVRRIETLKEIYFFSVDLDDFLDPWLVCNVWSRATAIIGLACLGAVAPVP